MAPSVSAVPMLKAAALAQLASFWVLLTLSSSVAAAPHQPQHQSTSVSAYSPEYYMEEEDEADTTVMIQVGVSTTATKKRVTGIQPSMDDDACGWGEPCDEEEEDGAMLFQERVVKHSTNSRKMLEESEFDDSSI
mmetsp:Transcript_86796/g.218485  ORF Transcript_86796/g.218485 Transcript_86796/m.218485 type:complete len:135 (+) Transcript_86796:48-452(+)|eukprot:CAMPEP_0115336882 /NCGR_PEP_ID=MMETSP0270-20121206/89235_1 /TAXON_ID=71861 /ORGANISM="Scrippsiella trochoidea, Strain CCMP3099" /LENGTH=134 /DNA_ID=CAMNT_0002758069 /DNA_START=40 /DNA_END=444 /DNA_ORIENTATION=+